MLFIEIMSLTFVKWTLINLCVYKKMVPFCRSMPLLYGHIYPIFSKVFLVLEDIKYELYIEF